MEPLLLVVQLGNDFEAADGEEVEDALLEHNLVVLGIHDLDDSHDGLSVLALQIVQVEHLLKEVPRLLVSQIAKVLVVVHVVEDLDVVDSLIQLLLTHLLNPVLVVVEDDREEDAAHEIDSDEDEEHEEDDRVVVSIVCWQHEVWEVLSREEHIELPIRVAKVLHQGRPLQTRKEDDLTEEGEVAEEDEEDEQRDKRVLHIQGNQAKRAA